MFVCILVLATFRFIDLAHLHSLWGCLAFVGFPSGFGLAGLGPCPLGFLFAVLVGFSLGCLHLRCGLGALASRRYGSFMGPLSPLGLRSGCSWHAFVGVATAAAAAPAAAPAAVAAPSLCALYLGAVQIKVHTHICAVC